MEQENTTPVELPAAEEKFEISMRLLGNEILAMSLLSQSKKKNWMVFGMISLVLIAVLLQQLVPVIEQLRAVM